MRKVVIFFSICLVLLGSIRAAETELSVDLMQTIEDTNKSLSSNIALKDVKGSTSDAKELTEMFAQVETFFVQKGGADNAVDLARKSKELAIQIVDSVAKNNFDAATDAATNLSRTCRTCHTFYKKE
jgi:hypothetical protein